MDITVLLCTRDRAASLDRTLDSMARLATVDASWELVVVDNGSTDDTPAIVSRYRDRLPIRRVFEPRAGLSNARNAGIDAATGAYIVWTDDDVLVDPQWLSSYAAAFRRYNDVAYFGGRSHPQFTAPVPRWLTTRQQIFGGMLAIRDFGDIPRDLDGDRATMPFGLNYAVRGIEQRACRYDPSLGVAPGRRLGGEEVDVIERIAKAGGRGMWIPEAIVHHVIPPARQTLGYVRNYYRAHGEATFAIEGDGGTAAWAGVPRWRWRAFLRSLGGVAMLRLMSGHRWVDHWKDNAIQTGFIQAALRAQRSVGDRRG